MKFEIETKRTLTTDNGNRFTEGSEIAFTYKKSGDAYIAEIVQIKKKSFIIRDIEINYYYNILISNNMDFMDILVNLNRRIRKLSSTGENIEAEKTAPKYTCIITSEADLPDKQLDYFSDNPWDGNLEEVIMFNTIGELFQHDVEGLFYQLYENEHGTRLGYGMVDPDYPAADIQDFEKKSEKKEQKLKLCLVRDKNTFHVGDKVIHFKWELNSEHTDNYIYEITGFPKNTETEEQYVAYRSVADPSKEWVRPIMEFLSEVDHQKYPEIKQKYRFVKY